MVLAREVEDKTLAATAIKPSRRAMRVVRIENEREIGVGRFGAMSSKLLLEEWGILTLAGASVWIERTNTSPKRLGTYVFVLTKRWNEDDPAR